MQANSSLSRQSAPSPQPILDAKNEIITLQQDLATREQTLQQMQASLADNQRALNQLKVCSILSTSYNVYTVIRPM